MYTKFRKMIIISVFLYLQGERKCMKFPPEENVIGRICHLGLRDTETVTDFFFID